MAFLVNLHIGGIHSRDYQFSRLQGFLESNFEFVLVILTKNLTFVQITRLDKFPRKGFLWTATIPLALTVPNTMGHQAPRARPSNYPTQPRIASNLKT